MARDTRLRLVNFSIAVILIVCLVYSLVITARWSTRSVNEPAPTRANTSIQIARAMAHYQLNRELEVVPLYVNLDNMDAIMTFRKGCLEAVPMVGVKNGSITLSFGDSGGVFWALCHNDDLTVAISPQSEGPFVDSRHVALLNRAIAMVAKRTKH